MEKTVKKHSRFETVRRILIFWCLFIGTGAVAGAAGMLTAPDGSAMGMQELLPYFQVMPLADLLYQNFIFPGIALLCINGIPNLIAAGLLLKRKKAGIICGSIFGVTLMLWICIQFVIFPMNFMSTSYFIFGFLQAVTGYMAWVFYCQEQFPLHNEDNANVGTDHSRLVVYFSRMGYTRAEALEKANRTGAELYEIKAAERTEGTLGFWWCGRFGMHRWDMPIQELPVDLTNYQHVTICSPIWVFHLAAPVRSFCRAAKGKIREADYILVHHQKSDYQQAAQELDDLLGLDGSSAMSVCCRRGNVLKRTFLPGSGRKEAEH